MNNNLAIIIPAYKATFLRESLKSLVAQTNQNFVVYLGDDNSPMNLEEIVREYVDKLTIVYKRFEDNLGGQSLVAQWKRCIELSTERYIWLFSDDDILPPDAVERFWKFEASHNGEFDICRLPLELINRVGYPIMRLEEYPSYMSSEEYLKKRLSCDVLSSASEYIFTRAIYEKYGFVEFPLAWCSDDASWAQMAKEKGLYTLDGLPVQLRMSGDNISSRDDNHLLKFYSNRLFIDWISNHFNIPEKYLYTYLRAKMWKDLTIVERRKVWKLVCITTIHRILLILNSRFFYKIEKYVQYSNTI